MTKTMQELLAVRDLYANPKIGPLLRQVDDGMTDLIAYREVLPYLVTLDNVGFVEDVNPDFGVCPEIDRY